MLYAIFTLVLSFGGFVFQGTIFYPEFVFTQFEEELGTMVKLHTPLQLRLIKSNNYDGINIYCFVCFVVRVIAYSLSLSLFHTHFLFFSLTHSHTRSICFHPFVLWDSTTYSVRKKSAKKSICDWTADKVHYISTFLNIFFIKLANKKINLPQI